jgi:hypothetical protein
MEYYAGCDIRVILGIISSKSRRSDSEKKEFEEVLCLNFNYYFISILILNTDVHLISVKISMLHHVS